MASYDSAYAFQHTKGLDGFEELLSPQASPVTMDPSYLSFSSASTSPFEEGLHSQPTSVPPSRSRSPKPPALVKAPTTTEEAAAFLSSSAAGGAAWPHLAGPNAAPIGSWPLADEGDLRRTSLSTSDIPYPSSHHSRSTSTSSSLWSPSVYDGLSFPSSDTPFLPRGVSRPQGATPTQAITTYSFAQNASAAHPVFAQHSQQQQQQQTAIRIDTSSLGQNMQFASPFTPLAAQLQQTKLFSPLGTDANGDSPTLITPGSALVAQANGLIAAHAQAGRRPGAMRTVSAIDLPRHRGGAANGNQAGGVGSPATPTIGFNPYPYPYPSPLGAVGVYKALGRRPSVPILNTGGFTHLNIGVNGQSVSPDMARSLSSLGGGQAFSPNALRASNGNQKRLHPLPSGLSEEFLGWDHPLGGMAHDDTGAPENIDPRKKPPRFRPSKEQLDILIASYQQNKNPDAKTRGQLAKVLGGNIKPKTLQIWFQNRRSKARAKERDAMNPKALAVTTSLDLSRGRRPSIEAELLALRALARSTDDNLVVLPVTVMSMSRWTRFLTPGSGRTRPDLGCALDLRSASPAIALYVVHSGETYRLSLSLSPGQSADAPTGGAVASVQAAENLQLQADSVAVRLEVRPARASFAMWSSGAWRPVGDFSGGVVSAGGRLELTGDREMMLSAFTHVRKLIGGNGNDGALAAAPLSAALPTAQSMFPKDWQFPSQTATSAHTQTGGSSPSPVSASDSRGPAFAFPPAAATSGLTAVAPAVQTSLSASAGMPNPMSSVFGAAQQVNMSLNDRHQRKRSCSAPTVPAFDPSQLAQGNAATNAAPAVPVNGPPSVMFTPDLSGGTAHGTGSAESTTSMLFPMEDWPASTGLADLPEEPASAGGVGSGASTGGTTMLNDQQQWMMAHAAMYGTAAVPGSAVADLDALGLFTQTFGNAAAGGSGSSQGSSASGSSSAGVDRGADIAMQEQIQV